MTWSISVTASPTCTTPALCSRLAALISCMMVATRRIDSTTCCTVWPVWPTCSVPACTCWTLIVDQALDFLGRFGAALRQGMHFTSHHCKATALRTGACSFYCSVERQDVGLEGNAINHADDVGNLARAGRNGFHGLCDLLHGLAALAGSVCSIAGQGGGLLGVVGVVTHGRSQLFHAGRSLLQVAGLLFGALRQVVVTGRDLGGPGGNGLAAFADAADNAQQVVVHALERQHQAAQLVLGGDFNVRAQIALCHGLGHLHGAVQVAGDGADDEAGADEGQHQQDSNGHCCQHHGTGAGGLCFFIGLQRQLLLHGRQLLQACSERAHAGEKPVFDEGTQTFVVIALKEAQHIINARRNGFQQGVDTVSQRFFLSSELGLHIGVPGSLRVIAHLCQRVLAGFSQDLLVVDLVRGLHQLDAVGIGNQLELLHGHHAVVIDAGHALVGAVEFQHQRDGCGQRQYQ